MRSMRAVPCVATVVPAAAALAARLKSMAVRCNVPGTWCEKTVHSGQTAPQLQGPASRPKTINPHWRHSRDVQARKHTSARTGTHAAGKQARQARRHTVTRHAGTQAPRQTAPVAAKQRARASSDKNTKGAGEGQEAEIGEQAGHVQRTFGITHKTKAA